MNPKILHWNQILLVSEILESMILRDQIKKLQSKLLKKIFQKYCKMRWILTIKFIKRDGRIDKTPLGNKENENRAEPLMKSFWNIDSSQSKSKQNTRSNFFEPSLIEKSNPYRSRDAVFNNLDEGLKNLNSPPNIFEKETDFDSFSKSLSDKKSFKYPRDELKSKSLASKIPLSKIYEIQDLMTDVNKEEFNDLPSK